MKIKIDTTERRKRIQNAFEAQARQIRAKREKLATRERKIKADALAQLAMVDEIEKEFGRTVDMSSNGSTKKIKIKKKVVRIRREATGRQKIINACNTLKPINSDQLVRLTGLKKHYVQTLICQLKREKKIKVVSADRKGGKLPTYALT
jgi:hypothetical protein